MPGDDGRGGWRRIHWFRVGVILQSCGCAAHGFVLGGRDWEMTASEGVVVSIGLFVFIDGVGVNLQVGGCAAHSFVWGQVGPGDIVEGGVVSIVSESESAFRAEVVLPMSLSAAR